MKTTQKTTKQIMGAGRAAKATKPRFDSESFDFPETKAPRIQWPTEEQIRQVSKRLSHINRVGIRWEEDGDYFGSGDLAYQIQEIIKATSDLFRKSQRVRKD